MELLLEVVDRSETNRCLVFQSQADRALLGQTWRTIGEEFVFT